MPYKLLDTVIPHRAHGQLAPKHVDHLHWKIQPRRRIVQAHPQISRPKQHRIVLRAEPRRLDTHTLEPRGRDLLLKLLLEGSLARHNHNSSRTRTTRCLRCLLKSRVERDESLEEYAKVLVGSPTRRRDNHGRPVRSQLARAIVEEVVASNNAIRLETHQQIAGLLVCGSAERGWRLVVEDARSLDAPLFLKERFHALRNAKMSISRPSHKPLIHLRHSDGRFGCIRRLHDRVPKVVPIDDQTGSIPKPGQRPCYHQCWDRRRVLHKHDTFCATMRHRHPQLPRPRDGRKRRHEEVENFGFPWEFPSWGYVSDCNVLVRQDSLRRSRLLVPNERNLPAGIRQRQRMVAHPRAPSQVSQHNHRGTLWAGLRA
mmetsp:Transcript_30262/g.59098  ORF Transcript_30262/g.59098 Transcript_30262/m.59098 type:complete len:371 (-) Transcript_30262:260-1372(-)